MEKNLIYDIIYCIAGFINYRYYSLSLDYLSSENREFLLLHFWTLSLQQQFYFIYPIFIITFSIYMKLLLLIITLFSFALCCYYSVYEVSYSFFSFTTRFWEIGFGCIFFIIYKMKLHSKILLVYTSIIALLFFSFFFNSDIYSYPSYITLVPVVCACFILNSTNNDNNYFLVNRALIFTGRISYSFYVIHYPILRALNNCIFLYLIIITYSSGYILYIKIEKYYSSVLNSSLQTIVLFQLLNFAYIIILIKLAKYNNSKAGFVFNKISGFNKFMEMQKSFIPCILENGETSFFVSNKFILLGDCHIQQWIPIISKIAFQHGYIVFHIYYWSYFIEKGKYNEVFTTLNSIGNIKSIFLSQFLGYKPYMMNYTQFSRNFKVYLNNLLKKNYTKDIFVIQNTGYSKYYVKKYVKNMKSSSFGYIGVNFTQNLLPIIQNVRMIDMNSYICKNKVCPFIIDGFIVYIDKHHLNPLFVEHLYYEFINLMNKKYEKYSKVVSLKRKGFYKTVICCNNKWKIKNRKCMIRGD